MLFAVLFALYGICFLYTFDGIVPEGSLLSLLKVSIIPFGLYLVGGSLWNAGRKRDLEESVRTFFTMLNVELAGIGLILMGIAFFNWRRAPKTRKDTLMYMGYYPDTNQIATCAGAQ